jgi:hypothetical protein
VSRAQGIATPDGSELPYQRIAELTFEDMDALRAGLAGRRQRHPELRHRRRDDLLRRDD